jgi:beta-galactosidase
LAYLWGKRHMKTPTYKSLVGSLVFSLASVVAVLGATPRERLLLDFGWKFHLGNEYGIARNLAKAGTGSGPASPYFSDASWRTVNLPHDWAVELPFDQRADMAHGFKALGSEFPQNSAAWYRRTFELPKTDAGRRLWLEFDGAFRDCTVFLNGWIVGRHDSGYSSFRYDVTDIANYGGKNVLAVLVDASEFEGWFYEGAGLYRHVWLVKTGPLAIAPDGTFVRSQFKDNVPGGSAKILIQTRLANAAPESAEATVQCEILDPDGKPVVSAEASARVDAASNLELEQTARVPKPVLWSPESPRLYKLITTVESAGKVVDRTETEFGIRTVGFDVEKGFLLNGEPYVLKGTCNHQDHAGVGTAMPDRLQYFRVSKLKEMGGNAYRTSHNPPTPELLEACDHLGLLVMDENRLLGSDPIELNRLERLIRRDRNHPSVVLWSIANEEFTVQGTPSGKRVAETMQALVKRLDPTRPVTYAAPVGNEFAGINEAIEVRGWNYHVGKDMDDYHGAHTNQPNVGTEQGSTVGTRGSYANDKTRGYVSAYDDNAPEWAQTAKTWWSYFAVRPWLSGGFVWTGFDYRGEPTPYGWPCINSHFGILDTCGFPKDNFWYYLSWWTNQPVLHLLPHWNWPGRDGQEIDVRALSNCQEVELLLNGRSLGKQAMPKNSELKWKVKYAPGTLAAKGYNAGKLAAEAKVETTGAPAAVQLDPDRAVLNADGEDISVFTVSLRDAQGRIVPVATNAVLFALEGPGRMLGVGNGDPSCHEPDVFVAKWPVHSAPIKNWRWHKIPNPYQSDLPETAPNFDDAGWTSFNAQAPAGPLAEREHAVFRATFPVTAEDLAAQAVEMVFGNISGDGWLFLNGVKVGESHDAKVTPVFDVKNVLRPGENKLALVVANYGNAGGISKGVTLQFQEQPAQPQWQRSVFNGLAQIIVQSSKAPGQLKLTARSTGLQPASATVKTQSGPLRPSVP